MYVLSFTWKFAANVESFHSNGPVDDHEVEICIREELKQLVIRDIVLYSCECSKTQVQGVKAA